MTNKLQSKNWRKVKLGEILEKVIDNRGKTPPLSKSGFSMIEVFQLSRDKKYPNMNDNKKQKYVSEDTYNKWFRSGHPKEGDILVSTVGTIAQWNLMPKESKYCIAQNVVALRPDLSKTTSEFLRFYFNQRKFVSQVEGIVIGATQPSVRLPHFLNLEINLPPLDVQKRIAEILSAFDDKIELNDKISRTLEEMAQAIFKEWFVKFRFPDWEKTEFVDSELGKIPEGWEVKKLPEVFDFLEGPGIRNWQYASKGCPFINIRLIQNNDINIKSANFISEKEANGKYKHFHLQERDMIVSTSGTLGRSAIVRKEHLPLLLNTSVIRFRPKDNRNYTFMYQFLNSAYFQNKILSMASGSAQPNFGPIHLKQIEVLMPNQNVLNIFNNTVNSIYERIIVNMSENQKLAALRDLLLPKLMSGEIRV